MAALTLDRNPNWRGGRTVDPRGYVLVKKPEHPRADCRGYVYEHILVAEQTLGRPIERGEIVHHRDENRSNNTPRNLEVLPTRLAHGERHRRPGSRRRRHGESNSTVSCACGCGQTFLYFDAGGRPRVYVSGHNLREGR